MAVITKTLDDSAGTSAETKLTSISWQEIKKHNNQDDCWIVIDQFVYDISDWVTQHPGGTIFTILAGEDATAMYYSNHFTTSKHYLEQFLIGTVNNHQPLFEHYQDDFFRTLKSRVIQFFKDNNIDYRQSTRNYIQIIITSFILFASWSCIYLLPPWGLLAAIPMGLATTSLIGSFGHEMIHGNLFNRLPRLPGYWILNNILWGLFIPFMPERYFQYEHIRHHNYPMHPAHDYDVYALKNIVRLSPDVPKKSHHHYQHIYAPFTYGMYIFIQLIGGYTTTFFDDREILKDNGNIRDIVMSSIVALSFHILLPIYLTSIGWVLLAAGIYFFTWQSAIYISSGLPHMTEVANRNENSKPTESSWAHYVCNTTKNVKAGNWFFTWLTGGLNHHLNHHLLPSIPQEHLHLITPIVHQTCLDFGYPYSNYTSFKDFYLDHYQFLKTLGQRETVTLP